MNEKYKYQGSIEDRVIEECSEVIKSITKARRFGYYNWHPDRPEQYNIKDIYSEMDQLRELLIDYEKYLEDVN